MVMIISAPAIFWHVKTLEHFPLWLLNTSPTRPLSIIYLPVSPWLSWIAQPSWCGPCKLVAPLMDQLAEEYGDQVTVVKLDVDTNKPVAKRFGIKSIPAVLFFKQGEQVDTVIGAKPYSEFKTTLTKHL